MIVDCHTHWGRAFTQRDGLDPAPWLAVLDAYGVTHAVVLPEAGLFDAGKIREDNDTLAAVCARSQGRMFPLCTANIWYRDDALAEVRRCLSGGAGSSFAGVKFHPWLQGCSVSAPAMDDICELAAEFAVPVLFHDGTPPFSLPSQMALLARRHPRTTIILGHSGLFEHWREAIAAMRAATNLWACFCGSYAAGMRGMLDKCDRARICWGTDFGYGLSDCFTYRFPVMRELGLSESELHAILSENPARLWKITA